VDKQVVFAVAGSGKTTRIVDSLDPGKRCLVLTYTEQNLLNLRRKVEDRFGGVPATIELSTYFAFLHSFFLRPVLGLSMPSRGLNFKGPPVFPLIKEELESHYMDGGRRLYANRLAKLIVKRGMAEDARGRLEKYFDLLCIDEVQDFGGNDFNLLEALFAARLTMLLVGDFHQNTYVTSHDLAVNKNLHADYGRYKARFVAAGIAVDLESLVKSWRCAPAVCEFIRDRVGVHIDTHSAREARVVLIQDQAEVDEIHGDACVVKLFWEKHAKYGCRSQTWGGSKGEDHYDEVCVALTKTAFAAYLKPGLMDLKGLARNKLYVALSRSRGNVYLVPQELFQKHAREEPREAATAAKAKAVKKKPRR
jgi:DNA helicase-2/ATP-dependent DNA helicase PcrA